MIAARTPLGATSVDRMRAANTAIAATVGSIRDSDQHRSGQVHQRHHLVQAFSGLVRCRGAQPSV